MTTLTHSDALNELAAALAKAQGLIANASKDSANPFFKAKYADLASVREAIRGPLAAHGLAVVQSPAADGATVSVETLLMHSSGQWIKGLVTATAKDAGPQAIGSCITYLRRYALQAFSGVAAEDDDGNAAEAKGKAQPENVEAPKGFEEWADDLAAAADSGTAFLQGVWKTSKPEYRAHLTKTNASGWESLKAIAAKVKVPEPSHA